MKKVQVSVDHLKKNFKGISYGVLLIGVMDEENIYARRVSKAFSRPELDYVRIRKDFTQDVTERMETVFEINCRNMLVLENVGLEDPRIKTLEFNKENKNLITEIENAVKEFHEYYDAI